MFETEDTVLGVQNAKMLDMKKREREFYQRQFKNQEAAAKFRRVSKQWSDVMQNARQDHSNIQVPAY